MTTVVSGGDIDTVYNWFYSRACKARNQCYDCVRLGNDAVGGSQMTCDPDSVLYSFKLAKEGDANVIHCRKCFYFKLILNIK